MDIAEGTTKGEPVQIQVTRIETTLPLCPPAIQRLPTDCVTKNVPCRTMFAIASKPRGERSSVRLMKLPAALLTRPVSGPPSSQIDWIIASTAAASRMSTACAFTEPPCVATSAAAVSSSTAFRRPHR